MSAPRRQPARPCRRATLAGLGALALPGAASARVASTLSGTVKGVSRYGRLRLDTLQTLRLADLEVPAPPAPWGRQGMAGLEALALGRQVIATPLAREPDRFGDIPARVWLADPSGATDLSLGLELLRLGLARVRPRPTGPRKVRNRAPGPDLTGWLEAEEAARLARRGLWRDAYRVHGPGADDLAQFVETFQIVRGLVTATGGGRERTYLNFGADWRTDTTVVVDRRVGRALARLWDVEPDAIGEHVEGARVEARGWVELVNGPSLWLDDPRALRILD